MIGLPTHRQLVNIRDERIHARDPETGKILRMAEWGLGLYTWVSLVEARLAENERMELLQDWMDL